MSKKIKPEILKRIEHSKNITEFIDACEKKKVVSALSYSPFNKYLDVMEVKIENGELNTSRDRIQIKRCSEMEVEPNLVIFRRLPNAFFEHAYIPIVYVDNNLNVWYSNIRIWEEYHSGNSNGERFSFSPGKFRRIHYIPDQVCYLQSQAEILHLLDEHGDLGKFARRNNIPALVITMYPQLELLFKEGFCFAEKIVDYFSKGDKQSGLEYYGLNYINGFGRLTVPGASFDEIFNVPSIVYSSLKCSSNLETWEGYRGLLADGIINDNEIYFILKNNFSSGELKDLRYILNFASSSDRLLSFDNIINFIDTRNCNGIKGRGALLKQLKMYLSACKRCGIDLDTDSINKLTMSVVEANCLSHQNNLINYEQMLLESKNINEGKKKS